MSTIWRHGVMAAFLVGTVAIADDAARDDAKRTDGSAPTRPLSEIRRASMLMNHNLVNAQNEKLGAIKDIVFNEDGKAKYVIVDIGGLLSDKYVAIPWRTLNPKFGDDHCKLDMSIDRLKGAPTFVRANYYERWTKEWCDSVHNYFGDARADEEKSRRSDSRESAADKPHQIFYASQLIGGTVQNRDAEKLTKIDDFLFDDMNRIAYAVIGTGTVTNRNKVAVPFKALQLQKGERGTAFAVLNMTPQQLEGAPTMSQSNYSDLLNRDFVATTDRFFGPLTTDRIGAREQSSESKR